MHHIPAAELYRAWADVLKGAAIVGGVGLVILIANAVGGWL